MVDHREHYWQFPRDHTGQLQTSTLILDFGYEDSQSLLPTIPCHNHLPLAEELLRSIISPIKNNWMLTEHEENEAKHEENEAGVQNFGPALLFTFPDKVKRNKFRS